jgi:CzcA family heavy metal efflux pump
MESSMLDLVIKFALRNRTLIIALAALLTAWGGKVMMQMPIDVFPDLNRPTVTVIAEAGGLAPEEVETLITTPLETSLNGLPGVIRVRSASSIGLAIVWVEFDWGTDLFTNRQLVSEKLATLDERIPDGVVPIMGPVSSLMGEIMLIGMTAKTTPLPDVRTMADWVIRPRLLAVPGVSQIIPIGGGVKEIHVRVDPRRLRELGLSLQSVKDAVANSGLNTTGGFVESGYLEFLVRNIARPMTLDQIRRTTVSVIEGVAIRLEQVATVSYGIKVMRGDASVNAQPAVIMAVQKQFGVNTVTLTKTIEEEVEKLADVLPADVEVHQLFKQAHFIETAIHNVMEALRDGSIFVAIVLFLFLLNFRTTMITLTAIPLSLLTTFVILDFFGITINTMTLGGMAVAIGELVDDAIVDVENVFRRLRQNKASDNPRSSLRVIYEASSEIRNSIVMATMIVILVFIPLFSLSGLEGKLFVPLGISYVVSILASLIVSLTVTPVLCSYLLPKAKVMDHEDDGWLVSRLKNIDRRVLQRLLGKPVMVLAVCLVLTIGALIGFTQMGREFLPPFNEGTVTAFVVSPPGTSLSESNRLGQIAERQLMLVPEIDKTSRRTGRAEEDEHAEGVYNSEIDVDLKPSERSRDEILGHIRRVLKEIPGIGVSLGQPISHRIDHMMSGVKSQIAIKIFGENQAELRRLADEVKTQVAAVDGAVDVVIEKVTLIPQWQIIPDTEQANQYGLTPGYLAHWLEDALSGADVSEVIDGQRRIVINVRVNEEVRSNFELLENLFIDTPTGAKVPLHSVAKLQRTTGPNAINHENARRRIIVMANTQGRDLGSVVDDIQLRLDDVEMPEGFFVRIGGQFESQQRASQTIAALSILSFIGVLLLLYSYFGSMQLSMQVMLNIPLALIGSVVAVYLSGGVFSIGTLVGFITLCGIASRNGILMISHYLHLMHEEGMAFSKEMVIKGSLERLVPVLMTALTAALALVPIVMAGGEAGKEILHPVAVVILGGLLSSTLLDIAVTPVIFYSYGEKAAKKAMAKLMSSDVDPLGDNT